MPSTSTPAAATPAAPTGVLRPVEEVILAGADVSVVNHTTLSLWHFQQLALQLLPSEPNTAEADVEADDADDPARDGDAQDSKEVGGKPRAMELGEGMSVAAILYGQNDENDTAEEVTESTSDPETAVIGYMTPATRVASVFKRYRCVICLDASPSTLSIDPSTGRLFLDLLYETVELFVWSLLRPMEVGGGVFKPELHVSVLVQGALVESLCVLLQGYIVTPENAAMFLQLVKKRIQLIEDDWAVQSQQTGEWGCVGGATPACLDWILQNAVFALHSLPTDSAPMLVLVSDGVVDLRDAYSYDNLLMQLVRHDIKCHFLRVGGTGDDDPNASFGFVPDTQLLRFIADSTGGTVLDYLAVHEACYGTTSASSNRLKLMTDLQDACFVRRSSVNAISVPVVKLDNMDCTSFDSRTLLPFRPYRMWREKVHEYRIFADVDRIVEARLREGFVINKVHVKTFQLPFETEDGAVPRKGDELSGAADSSNAVAVGSAGAGSSGDSRSREVTKILVVFLLQWKQNVWLEYVISTTIENAMSIENSATTTSQGRRRLSSQGMKAPLSSSTKKPAAIFTKDQTTKWSEWYVKMNILAYGDFLRAFEDSRQRSTAGGEAGSDSRGGATQANGAGPPAGSPFFVHDFIRNVQDVDRVLLHLMTATASIAHASESAASQFSFGSSSVAPVSPQHTSSHPVFNIIGDLSTVLWHRWFFVERFELLCVVKDDECKNLFYRSEDRGMADRGNSVSHMRGSLGHNSQAFPNNHGVNVYGASGGNNSNNGTTFIGVDSLAEPLVSTLLKWSSQKLSQDLFLKFLSLPTADKSHMPPRVKASGSSSSVLTGGIMHRHQQRGQTNTLLEEAGSGASTSSSGEESKASLCFVRIEFKSKTVCAVHVAFFATGAAVRRQVLFDLKNTIFAGMNDVTMTLAPSSLLAAPLASEVPVILCHRMLSRLLVAHETLLLHGIDQEPGPFDRYVTSPALEAEQNTGEIPPANVCCGGSELQLLKVFGAYMWHASWKWEVPNPSAMLTVMQRLHEARISCGFWVLDWKMAEEDDGQGIQVESVVFGREILMEDEKGRMKTALLQYALRRVSETCLMTSFWMEPQTGVVKSRLAESVDYKDNFHWSLKQAIGHSMPFEDHDGRRHRRSSFGSVARGGSDRPTTASGSVASSSVEDELHSMEQEDVSIDWTEGPAFLDEIDLLQLIRDYLFKSDRHFLSCLYTFDCVLNLRESIELMSQLSKDVEGIVGSNWPSDRRMAAENGMILPPFSTARLLGTSKRSTEHFLMYLESENVSNMREEEPQSVMTAPAVSPANEHLYSMLERTLRGLSDCEVSWTDYNGDVVSKDPSITTGVDSIDEDRFFRKGMDGQLPLWLKNHLAMSFKDRVPHHALSKGKCFAKLVSDDCVVLAFFPSLDTLQVQHKGTGKAVTSKMANDVSTQLKEKLKWSVKHSEKKNDGQKPVQQFSVLAAAEDGSDPRVVRMSASADDIVLYQERRRSFREGYKSWRMGHYQGSRDEKKSYGRDFQKLRLTSTPEDHEFCEELSRQATYGCDFHLLIEDGGGVLGSGFFQVAFYECSITRLSTSLNDMGDETTKRVDLPQTILKQLFFTDSPPKPRDERPGTPLDRSGRWKKSPSGARGSLNSSFGPFTRPSPDSSSVISSRQFRKKIKRAHEHNFSRGVYIALREGGAVQQSDLLQALSSCLEVPVDVDITLLYRMMEAAAAPDRSAPLSPSAAAVASTGIGADILKDKLTKSFEKILSSVFVPIPGTKYYYYTGNENMTYEDFSEGEYDLHFLMEDSEDGEGAVACRTGSDGATNMGDVAKEEEEDPRVRFSRSAGENVNAAARRRSSLGKTSTFEHDSGAYGEDKHGSDVSRSNETSARGLPPPVLTSNQDDSGGEQQHVSVEEDAEFNKEVAVATSSFSVPFFFRFECRVLNGPRESLSSAIEAEAAPNPELLMRSSSNVSYVELRKHMIAKSHTEGQMASAGTRQKEFDAFLASLKGNGEGSQATADTTDVTNIAEWFSKAPSGRIALRLVTLTLPNERAFDGVRPIPEMPFEMDDGSGQMPKHNALPSTRSHNFSNLHLFQRQVLTRARKDIKEWSSMEILSILKSTNKITPAIGALVQRLFEDLPANSITKANYPLDFVAHNQETQVNPLDLFKRELEKGELLSVHPCNGVYFVVQNKNPTDGASIGATTNDNSESKSDSEGGITESCFQIPYWAFFELGSDHISLCLHHPDRIVAPEEAINRLTVLTELQLGVRALCRRVNQFLLLLQLHETRTCNGLLLPPNGNYVSSPRSPKRRNSATSFVDASEGRDGQTKPKSFFWPGQFECDLRYSSFFKLHERLAPTFALNMLCTSALEQFQVHNRRHIFVYRDRDGHVFYMKISIHYEAGAAPVPLTSPVSRGSATEERHDRATFSRQSTGGSTTSAGSTSTSTVTPTGVPGILLEVFGVSEAGEEVTHELCRLLERKLDEATQVMLMKLLARNTKFQLSQMDLAFLCPPAVAPASKVDYVLPRKVVEFSTLLHFLSQSLKVVPYIRPVASSGRNGTQGTLRGGRRGSFASVAPPRASTLDESLTRDQANGEMRDNAQTKVQPSAVYDTSCVHPACFGDYIKAVADSQTSGEQPWVGYDAAVLSPVYFSTVPLPGSVPVGVGPADTGTTATSGDGEHSSRAAVPPPLPELVSQASYVLNLNPDLRLSQGFLSRVGKGLALMRVELIRNCPVEVAHEDEETKEEGPDAPVPSHRVKFLQDLPGLAALSPDGVKAVSKGTAPLVARCQVWIRGGINAEELSQVVETFLEEALYDYHIETTIRELQASSASAGHPDDASSADSDDLNEELRLDALGPLGHQQKLPAEVDTLVSLLENASRLPSSSVTKLGLDLPIAPWDLGNAVTQMRSFLCCLPTHLRPKVYAKPKPTDAFMSYEGRSDAIRVATSAWRQRLDGSGEAPLHFFRLIVKHTHDSNGYGDADSSDSEAETTTSMSSATHHIEPLMRADSIHSEISDLDSVSGRLPPTWASVAGSESNLPSSQVLSASSVASTSSSAVGTLTGPPTSLQMPYMPRSLSFSESDVLLYPNSSSHHHHRETVAPPGESTVQLGSRRSFYYVLDVSANAGVRLYGYNMSSSLVEALATHMARVLTWSVLRSKLLHSLLLEKTGLAPAAPVGSIVLQPRNLLLAGWNSERDVKRAGSDVGKTVALLCKDSSVHFIEYWASALSILQGNDVFPKVLDASRLRSIEGTALGKYLREAHTQPASDALDHQLQRPRAKSNASLGAPVGSTAVPDLSREASGHSSQWSAHGAGDNVSGATGSSAMVPTHGKAKSGGILSAGLKPDKTSVSPTKRLGGGGGLPYTGNRTTTPRIGGGGGAATALMAARARARGGGFPGRLGAGPGVGASRGGSSTSSSSGGDNVAPWDLPLSNVKGPRLHGSNVSTESTSNSASTSSVAGLSSSAGRASKTVTSTAMTTATTTARSSSFGTRRGTRNTGKPELRASTTVGVTKPTPQSKTASSALTTDSGRINSSWKKRLESAWGPRFLFPGNTDRWAPAPPLTSLSVTRQHLQELEEDENDDLAPKKNLSPLRFFCAALDKRWEAFETRSTSHMVGLNLLEKLATLKDGEEMEEPVAKDVVAHLVESGHLLLHQRFRAAFVERWVAAETVAAAEDEAEGGRLRALQSCMDLVNLLSYKREVVFDGNDCAVAKLYTEHTVRSMGGDAGDDVRELQQQVESNLTRLRLEVASEFFQEYALHLCALGFRRLRTLSHVGSHARSFPVAPATDGDSPGFSEYFYRSEVATAEDGGWKASQSSGKQEESSLALVLLEVRCDYRGVRLSAVVVSQQDLEQQDLRFQHHLVTKRGCSSHPRGVCGRRVRSVASWLRSKLQTRELIYGFTIRYVQQTLLHWLRDSQNFHAAQQSSEQQMFEDDQELSVEPSGAWKDASSFQNLVKGLQCFLRVFPAPPNGSTDVTTVTGTPHPDKEQSCDASTPTTSASQRTTPRAVRTRRLPAKIKQPQQKKPLLWRDCLVRTLTVTLQPTSLHSNCFEPILVQMLLRYIACHGTRYEVLDLLQFGTPDAVVCHSSSGSFFHRPPSQSQTQTSAEVSSERFQGYSLVITTQPVARRPLDRDCIQLVLLKSATSPRGVGNGVLGLERALQEAQLFVRELFRVAAQHYERDLLWARLLVDEARGPGAAVARALALPPELFRVEVGPQQLEECLRLSLCTPLEALDPRLDELLRVAGVCWQELALRLRDIYADQLREFQFQEDAESSSHMLLLCPDTFDIIIHLVFVTPKDKGADADNPSRSDMGSGQSQSLSEGSYSSVGNSRGGLSMSESDGSAGEDAPSVEEASPGELRVEICRREEPPNKQFSFAQRRAISEFVNSIVHWQWRSLIYD